jgi:hypothetical protein
MKSDLDALHGGLIPNEDKLAPRSLLSYLSSV